MLRTSLLCCLGFALTVTATAADFDAANATNQVGLDLFRDLATQRSTANLVLSPYSIESALALVYAGADGATRQEMARALHFPTENAPVSKAFAALREALEQVAAQSRAAADQRGRRGGQVDTIDWNAANRLFGQQGYAFRDSFLDSMKVGFGAPFEALDFRRNSEGARRTINSWVEEQTRRKIRDLVPMGALTDATRLVLVNAVYLKAPWQKPFEKTATKPQTFHFADGASREVPTMHLIGFLRYAKESGLSVVALDYLGSTLQFLILLPDEGQSLDATAAKLTPADFVRWAISDPSAGPASVSLYLPKFRVEGQTLPLGPALRTSGIKSAFNEPRGTANFDRIAPRNPDDYLFLSEVFHQTFVTLDEEGTEAAAATAAVMAVTLSMQAKPKQPIEVHVDRPFLFAIQHRASGACLFLGRINDPR